MVSRDLVLSDEVSVGGAARVGGKLEAESVDVGGDLRSEVVRARDAVRVGRSLVTDKGTKAAEVIVNRNGKAVGPVVGGKVRVDGGSSVEDVYAEELRIGESSDARNVYARRVEVGDNCRIGGKLQYTDEIRVGKNVQLSSQPEKVSSLPSPPL